MNIKVLIPFILLLIADSCSREPVTRSMVVINPVHYHAALVQKNHLEGVSDTINVYAPKGEELDAYLKTIESFNGRAENPTHWTERIHICDDYMDSLPVARDGDFVILACQNNKKPNNILSAVKKGYNVLADKPMVIDNKGFELLKEAYSLANHKGLLIFDLMTERHDILNILVRRLVSDENFFGKMDGGVRMTSIHHFYKKVTGSTLVRPEWYYDIYQQGEGIADVTTHLIDLVFWQCFPEKAIRLNDIKVVEAKHYPTEISISQYKQSTNAVAFPEYLNYCQRDSIIDVMSNGNIDFDVKGTPVNISVRWDFQTPDSSGDTFESVYNGSRATVRIVQNESTNFKKLLVVSASESSMKKAYNILKKDFPSLNMTAFGKDSWILDVAPQDKLGHEDHFSLTCGTFLKYLKSKDAPDWETTNTLTKYYITTEAVRIARNEK